MKNMISKSIFVMALFLSVCIYGQVPESERAALIAFYEGTSPELWRNTDNWGTDEPVSNWYGVTVSEGRVTELRLGENRLRGSIPTELWTLTELTHLDLFRNNLDGTISSEIGNLSNLRVLKIGGNFLNGLIPPELWTLTELTELSFTGISTRRTALQGPIPAELGNLTNLTILSLSYTHSLFLEAGLPEEIGQLQSLRRLSLRNSSFSGVIPTVLGTLNSLEHLNFRLNNLSGAIPPGIATLPNLEAFNVSGNRLDFSDLEPTFTEFQEKEDFIFDYLPQYVGRVDVARTELITEGEPTILRVSEEYTLSDNNRFQWYNAEGIIEGATGASYTVGNGTLSDTGTYHYRITNTVVTGLTLRSHDIKVKISERAALMAIYNATDGPNWVRQENWGTDAPLSEWEGIGVNEEGQIVALYMSNNGLVGDLPIEIGHLEFLEFLLLIYEEGLTSIPESIGYLENLKELRLINNYNLTSIPESIGALINLEYLDLSYIYNLTLPESIGDLENLKELDLVFIGLTSLPESIEYLQNLETLHLSYNSISSFGSIENLEKLEHLFIEENGLTSFPESVLENINLKTLDLTGNNIPSFPESIVILENLEYLDLASNELTSIPESILEFNKLEYLTLNNNYLHFDDLEPISDAAFLTFSSSQAKVGEEEFLTVGGGTVTLSSVLTSSSHTTYRWFKDGVEIEGAINETYVIENVNDSDDGVYYYVAANDIVVDLILVSKDITIDFLFREGRGDRSSVVGLSENVLISSGLTKESSVFLFPNPANIGSDVTITGIHAEDVDIIILNTAGISISKIEGVQIRNDEYIFNTSNLSSGMYIVKIINKEDGTAITKRIIINSSE